MENDYKLNDAMLHSTCGPLGQYRICTSDIILENIDDKYSWATYENIKLIVDLKGSRINCAHLCECLSELSGIHCTYDDWVLSSDTETFNLYRQCLQTEVVDNPSTASGKYNHYCFAHEIIKHSFPMFVILMSKILSALQIISNIKHNNVLIKNEYLKFIVHYSQIWFEVANLDRLFIAYDGANFDESAIRSALGDAFFRTQNGIKYINTAGIIQAMYFAQVDIPYINFFGNIIFNNVLPIVQNTFRGSIEDEERMYVYRDDDVKKLLQFNSEKSARIKELIK